MSPESGSGPEPSSREPKQGGFQDVFTDEWLARVQEEGQSRLGLARAQLLKEGISAQILDSPDFGPGMIARRAEELRQLELEAAENNDQDHTKGYWADQL